MRTYINSVNVLFQAPHGADPLSLGEQLTQAVSAHMDLRVPVLVRTRADLGEVLAELPEHWRNDKAHSSNAIFLLDEFQDADPLDRFTVRSGLDEVIVVSRVILWRVSRSDQARSGLRDLLGNPVYRLLTMRTVGTVRRLGGLMGLSAQA